MLKYSSVKGDGIVEDIRVRLHRTLIRVNSKLGKRLKTNLEQYNLSGAEYGILRSLGPESLTLSEISQRLLRVNSNTTVMIDNLEKKGWVERVRDQEDRRVIRVRLTPEGIRMRDRVLPQHSEFIREVLSPMTDQEVAQILVLLAKIEAVCEGEANPDTAELRM